MSDGMRPALVCGCCKKPISSRSLISLRMVAGLSCPPHMREIVRDPTGMPEAM